MVLYLQVSLLRHEFCFIETQSNKNIFGLSYTIQTTSRICVDSRRQVEALKKNSVVLHLPWFPIQHQFVSDWEMIQHEIFFKIVKQSDKKGVGLSYTICLILRSKKIPQPPRIAVKVFRTNFVTNFLLPRKVVGKWNSPFSLYLARVWTSLFGRYDFTFCNYLHSDYCHNSGTLCEPVFLVFLLCLLLQNSSHPEFLLLVTSWLI